MITESEAAINLVQSAKSPTDVFGSLQGASADVSLRVKSSYRRLARLIYPDVVEPRLAARAKDAFIRLEEFKAQADILLGAAPSPETEPVVITSRKRPYVVTTVAASGDIATIYRCTYDDAAPGLLKVTRHPGNNDLIQAEAASLRHLLTADRPEASGLFPLLPPLIDSFGLRDQRGAPIRQANVFRQLPDGLVTLEQVHAAYPAGVSPKHIAWIWRQLLLVLGYAHTRGIIHGAVLPTHVLVRPREHDLLLIDWCYAIRDPVASGAHIPAVSRPFIDWYPPEVMAKKPPSPGTDILMSARCMIQLTGGDPLTGELPSSADGLTIPPRLSGFLQSCLLAPVSQRPPDAWQLRDEFSQFIEELWGLGQRLPLTMPRR